MLWLLHPSWSPAVAVAVTWKPSPDGPREEELACPLLMLGGGAALAIIAVVTMLLNLLLIFAILVNRQSRSRSFPLHIVNLAASAILQGAGILPLWSYYLISGTWLHGDDVCRWWLAADIMATCASALSIIFMACDRFVYLVCWKHVQEGSKYVLCCTLLALAWLLALTLTLLLSLTEDTHADRSGTGPLEGNHCLWGEEKRGTVAIARVIVYFLGAGLGAGLSLALTTLSCLSRGVDVLPIEEDDWEKKEQFLAEEPLSIERAGSAPRSLPPAAGQGRPLSASFRHPDERSSEADRHDEREQWRGQVVSLVVVAVGWALMWLPSHLCIFADVLALDWQLSSEVVGVFVVVGYANAAVTPLLWLLHKPIRSVVADVLCCRCCQLDDFDDEDDDEGDDEVFEEVFQEMPPYRPALRSTKIAC